VGVWFSPQSYYLQHAQVGDAGAVANAFHGYCRALVRKSIPFVAVEEEHLDVLDGLQALFLPRTLVLTPDAEQALMRFVERGGTLVAESECGAFTPQGLYRYPAERMLARLTGVAEVGRRQLPADTLAIELDGAAHVLGLAQWITPLERGRGRVLADHPDGALLLDVSVGKGRVVLAGGYFGESYRGKNTPGFESFVDWTVRTAGVRPEVEIIEPLPDDTAFLYIKHGASQGRRMVYVFFQERHQRAHLRFPKGFFKTDRLTDLISGEEHAMTTGTGGSRELRIPCPHWRFAVLVEANV